MDAIVFDRAKALFAAAASRHGRAMEKGDHVRANRAYEDVRQATAVIHSAADHGVAALLDLMGSDCPSTKKTAAYFLLPHCEEAAIAALENVGATAGPLVGLDAQMVLNEWRSEL